MVSESPQCLTCLAGSAARGDMDQREAKVGHVVRRLEQRVAQVEAQQGRARRSLVESSLVLSSKDAGTSQRARAEIAGCACSGGAVVATSLLSCLHPECSGAITNQQARSARSTNNSHAVDPVMVSVLLSNVPHRKLRRGAFATRLHPGLRLWTAAATV